MCALDKLSSDRQTNERRLALIELLTEPKRSVFTLFGFTSNIFMIMIHDIMLFKVIKHITLNTKENPCESTASYNVLSCVEKKLISKTGCRPPWTDSSSTVRLCSYENDLKAIRQFMALMSNITFMGTQRLYTEYGCMRPCTYFEYKVTKFFITLCSVSFLYLNVFKNDTFFTHNTHTHTDTNFYSWM